VTGLTSLLTGGVAGVAIGEAASTALDPVFELPKQDAWAKNRNKILNEGQLAQLVAEALNAVSDVIEDVNRNGYDADNFLSLVQLALKAPGVPDAEKLYLRAQGGYPGAITLAQLHHAYGKAGLEGQWWEALTQAAENQLLTPAQIALGIIRSLIPDPGLMPVQLDTTGGVVKSYPGSTLDALKEAAAAGINEDRLRVLVGTIGLPPSTQQLASMLFRGIIEQPDYYRGILEGDARPEWADSWLAQAREILTSRDYSEAYLRNWITDQQDYYAKVAQHGMSTADADLLFLNTGRPIPIHRVTQGLAIESTEYDDWATVNPLFLQSLEQSNVRPPWYKYAYLSQRWTWPAPFILKDLIPDPLTIDEGAAILTYQGWNPALALAAAKSFAAASGKSDVAPAPELTAQYESGLISAETYVSGLQTLGYSETAAQRKQSVSDARPTKSARTSLITKTKAAYVGGALDQAQATVALNAANVSNVEIPKIIALWSAERTVETTTAAA
jgi:hypothetical protein